MRGRGVRAAGRARESTRGGRADEVRHARAARDLRAFYATGKQRLRDGLVFSPFAGGAQGGGGAPLAVPVAAREAQNHFDLLSCRISLQKLRPLEWN